LKILPFRNADIDMKVNQLNQYAEEVRRNIPDLLLATMNILYSQYKEIKYLFSETNDSNFFYLNLHFSALDLQRPEL